LLRRRHADICGAAVGAAVACASLADIGRSSGEAAAVTSLFASELRTFAVLGTIFAIGGFGVVRIWRKLWRYEHGRWEEFVYGYGVRGYGAFMALAILTWCSWEFGRHAFGPGFHGGYLALGFLTGLVTGVPLGLCLGYFWGIQMAAFLGIKRSDIGSSSKSAVLGN
jgi:hypothetical protein